MNVSCLRLLSLFFGFCLIVAGDAFSLPSFLSQPRNFGLMATPSGGKVEAVKRAVNKVKSVSKKVVGKVKKGAPSEDALAAKYAAINDLEERAFQILVDLGMVTENKGKAQKL